MSGPQFISKLIQNLDIIGLNLMRKTTWSKRKFVAIATLVYLVIELSIQFVFTSDYIQLVKVGVSWIGAVELLCMLTVLITKKSKFVELLNSIEKFWSWDDLDMKLKSNFTRLSTLLMRCSKLAAIVLFSLVIGFCLKPLFTDDKTLPFDTYHPTDRSQTLYYSLIYLLHILITVEGTFIIFTFEALFVIFIFRINCELKIIKQKLLNIKIDVANDDNSLDEIGMLVEHHNLVLRCIKYMNDIYTGFLLLIFVGNSLMICATLLCLATGDFLQQWIDFSPLLIVVTSTIFVYCLGGTFIMNESQSVADAVYESEWWVKTQPQFRRACMMMIQRANKTEYLTAGGMFTLELETFTKIMEFSYSLFSLAQAANSNNSQQ